VKPRDQSDGPVAASPGVQGRLHLAPILFGAYRPLSRLLSFMWAATCLILVLDGLPEIGRISMQLVLPAVAAATCLASLGQRIPVQNVMMIILLTLGSTWAFFPWTHALDELLSGSSRPPELGSSPGPAALAAWVCVASLTSRELARLAFARKHCKPSQGWACAQLIFATGLALLFLACAGVFQAALEASGPWMYAPSWTSWLWAFTYLASLHLVATPWLVNKQSATTAVGIHSFWIWIGFSSLWTAGLARQGRWAPALGTAAILAAVCLAHRWHLRLLNPTLPDGMPPNAHDQPPGGEAPRCGSAPPPPDSAGGTDSLQEGRSAMGRRRTI